MSNSKLKIIACVTMLIDHIGYILLPEAYFLRLIGRIAMPIFAFLIGEGCRYTKNRWRYFLQVFLLGIFSQFIFLIDDYLSGGVEEIHFNILITFTFSIVICYIFLDFKEAYKSGDNNKTVRFGILLIAAVLASYAFLRFADNVIGMPVSVDYGIRGILIPMFAIVFTDKKKRVALFAIVLTGFLILANKGIITIVFTSISYLILLFYNGTYGSKKLKYLFYIFYPAHLIILYSIKYLIN